jgi:hypothetical protein
LQENPITTAYRIILILLMQEHVYLGQDLTVPRMIVLGHTCPLIVVLPCSSEDDTIAEDIRLLRRSRRITNGKAPKLFGNWNK